jgi:hypothetical protein
MTGKAIAGLVFSAAALSGSGGFFGGRAILPETPDPFAGERMAALVAIGSRLGPQGESPWTPERVRFLMEEMQVELEDIILAIQLELLTGRSVDTVALSLALPIGEGSLNLAGPSKLSPLILGDEENR